ncbi:MAG: serine/threonine-protein kinase [Gammaproteobacteria bacterium]
MSSNRRAVQVGDVLARRFALVEHVASGGIMTVYRARDLLADRYDPEHSTVAVKIISRELRANMELSAAVLRTAARMRTLHHPNIEQVLELHQFDDDYVIVSEWLDGETLAQKFDRDGPLSIDELAPVLSAVVAALDCAHASDIVHGDIKPGNVFLCRDGRVKLLDFGFRRPAAMLSPAATDGGNANTCTGLYASCEVLQDLPPVPQDDYYSLACLIYRISSGDWPYGLRTAVEAESVAARPVRPANMSRKQWNILCKGLAFRRADRVDSARELIRPFVTGRPRGQSHRTRWLTLAVLGLAIIVAAAWITRSQWPSWLSFTGVLNKQGTVVMPAPIEEPPRPVAAMQPATQSSVAAPSVAVPGPAVAHLPSDALFAGPPDLSALESSAPDEVTSPAPQIAGGPPTIGFSVARVVVPDSVGFIKLTVRAFGRLRGPVVLSVVAKDGAAHRNEDYVAPAPQLILTPRHPTGDILISLLHHEPRRHVEDFSVDLKVIDGYAQLGTASVLVALMTDSERRDYPDVRLAEPM